VADIFDILGRHAGAEVDAFHAHDAGEAGLHVTRDYLAISGRRR
jgi:hypothetical protein